MKKLFIATAAVLASLASSAHAADLPSVKAAPEAPPPPPEWTGFYLGANAGYDWSITNTIQQTYLETLPGGFATQAALGNIPGLQSVKTSEFIGGGQVGWNYQWGKHLLIGFETDFQGLAGGAGTANFISRNTATSFSKSLGTLGTVRGRIGYLVGQSFLLYGTGGFAYGQGTLSSSYYGAWPTTVGKLTQVQLIDYESSTLTGFAVGGGLEWQFLPKWTVKAEYLYYNLGTQSTPGVQLNFKSAGFPALTTAQSFSRFDGSVVRVGVNYHIKWGGAPKVFNLEKIDQFID
jgi:outer membrane immunogenic protein